LRALGEVTNPTGRLPAKEFDNRFRFHTAAQRWAAGMEAEIVNKKPRRSGARE